MKRVRIYVTYYDEVQRKCFGDLPTDFFAPWNVQFNLASPLLELDLFKTLIADDAMWTYCDVAGIFSWKFLRKSAILVEELMTNLNRFRLSNDEALVLNPAIANNALFANGFEQGTAVGHVHLTDIAREIGFGNYTNSLLRTRTFCASSYIVATRDFWRLLVFFLEESLKIATETAKVDKIFAAKFFGSAGYHRNLNLDYRPFLIERLVQVFLENTVTQYFFCEPGADWFRRKFGATIGSELYFLYQLKSVAPTNGKFRSNWHQNRIKILSNSSLTKEILHGDDPAITL